MGRVDSATGATPKGENDRSTASIDSAGQIDPALKEENRRLHELTEYRSALMAHLAHELRTPLTSILGFSEILLSQEKLTDAQRNFCERIQNSAHQLQRTLNQLAELSRLDAKPEDAPSRESSEK
jgi:signal transduction histidine kinase